MNTVAMGTKVKTNGKERWLDSCYRYKITGLLMFTSYSIR